MPSDRTDRLFELLPVVYRQRDEEQGHLLRDLLRVIAEQVNLIEDDVAHLYENWFIETCDDWVVPYIGELVGYGLPPSGGIELQSRLRTRALAPRRGVANYLRDLRRRGTLALLEELAADVGGFSARAVEYYRLLGRTQWLNHVNHRGGFVNLRDVESLDLLEGPFDTLGHTADLRSINPPRPDGRHNIPTVGAWLWRLRSFPVTNSPAYLVRGSGYFFFTFSALGNDAPLFTKAEREPDIATVAGEINVPTPIRRRALEEHVEEYYGEGKSFAIWIQQPEGKKTLVPASDIVSADLTDWEYTPPAGKVVVDPQLGRIAVADEPEAMWISYYYGFSGEVGAHESPRPLYEPPKVQSYYVGEGEDHSDIASALQAWQADVEKVKDAVIEITDSGFYTEKIEIQVPAEHTLQLRAANRCRPVIHLLDYAPSHEDPLSVVLEDRSRFTLDGLLIVGRPLEVRGEKGEKPVNARLVIRRSTLVPGWGIHPNCDPKAPDETSLDLRFLRGGVTIDRSIVGRISVMDETTESEPLPLTLTDSIIDSTSFERKGVVGPGSSYAWATMRIARCTFFGSVQTHAIELAENSIFMGVVQVVRRQIGCIRFCWVHPKSRTPKRYHCQPDLVGTDPDQRRRVEPVFGSVRFGAPDYAQLAFDCAVEITQGADDESEMGAFHDLFLPQRIANVRMRLTQATPSGMETGIIFAD